MVIKQVWRRELDNTLSGLPDCLFHHIYSLDRLFLVVLSHDDGGLLVHHDSASGQLYAGGSFLSSEPLIG